MREWQAHISSYDPIICGSIDGTDTLPHDHGIIRAIDANYQPDRTLTTDPNKSVFVGHINPATTEDIIREFFGEYGSIRSCRLVRDLVTGASRGYAFVEFDEERSATRAWQGANKLILEGHELFVEHEFSRSMPGWVPRRLGGGLGGRKESGQLRFGGRFKPFKKPILVDQERKWGDDAGHQQEDRSQSRDHDRSYRWRSDREREQYRDSSMNDRMEDDRSRDRGHSRDEHRHRSHSKHSHKDRSRSDHRKGSRRKYEDH